MQKENLYMAVKDNNKKDKSKKKTIVIVGIVLLLLISAVSWYFILGPGRPPLKSTDPLNVEKVFTGANIKDGVFTEGMTADEIDAAMQAVADKDNFVLNVSPDMYFRNGKSVGTVKIINSKENVYPISLEVSLDKDGTVVYRTGQIKPNQFITEDTLLVNLPKGTYKATGLVNVYSEDGATIQGQTSVEMNIFVES